MPVFEEERRSNRVSEEQAERKSKRAITDENHANFCIKERDKLVVGVDR